MATVEQVAKAALQKILVQASEAELQPDEYQDIIFTMNNFMTALDADGYSLGYTVVSSLGDTVTIPAGALRGLIYNLAVEAAPEYGGVVTPECAAIAKTSLATMQRLGQYVPTSSYPGDLPIGSGNEGAGYRYSAFYQESEADILAETNGAIALEDNTQ